MIDPETFDERLQKTIDHALDNIRQTPLATHLQAAFGCWVALIAMYVLFVVAGKLGATLGPGLFLLMASCLICIWLVRTYYPHDSTDEKEPRQ